MSAFGCPELERYHRAVIVELQRRFIAPDPPSMTCAAMEVTMGGSSIRDVVLSYRLEPAHGRDTQWLTPAERDAWDARWQGTPAQRQHRAAMITSGAQVRS